MSQHSLQIRLAIEVRPNAWIGIEAVLETKVLVIQACNDIILELDPSGVSLGCEGAFVGIRKDVNVEQPDFK